MTLERELDPILDRILPVGLAALGMAGVYRDQRSLAVLSVLLLAILVLARYWARHALDSVTYERELSADRAFPDDDVLLTVRLANRKWLPLPWIELSDAVPEGLEAREETDALKVLDGQVRQATPLLWHVRISWRYRVHCLRRGVYSLGPAELTSGDPLGVFTDRRVVGQVVRLVVYPRLVAVDRLAFDSDFPLGERNPQRWIFEDPSRVSGVREYRSGDSLRRIHWKATARRQELQSKALEPTTMLNVALVLASDSFGQTADGDPGEAFERAVSVAASIASELIERRHPVGMYASLGADNSRQINLAPAAGADQLIRILEALAGVSRADAGDTASYLAGIARRLPWGTSLVVLAGQVSEPLTAAVESLRKSGHRTEIVRVAADSWEGLA